MFTAKGSSALFSSDSGTTARNLRELSPGQIVLDARQNKKGIALLISDRSTLQLALNDGKQSFARDSDPGIHPGTLRVNVWQHVSVIVDGAAKVVGFVVDGTLNDGGAVRDYGFGRFPPGIRRREWARFGGIRRQDRRHRAH
jgi:hypothetical protein